MKTHLRKYLFYIIVIILLSVASDYFWKYFYPDCIDNVMDGLFLEMLDEVRLSLVIEGGILFFTCYLVCDRCKDRDVRPEVFYVAIIGLLLLWWMNPFIWVETTWCNIRRLTTLSIFLLVINESIKLYKLWKGRKSVSAQKNREAKTEGKDEKRYEGFRIDNTEIIVNESYVSLLIDSLMKTDTSQHAFSVSIVGGWGTGKTSFLNTISRKVKDRAYVVTFNPWICAGSSNVLSDFFDSIQNEVGKEHSQLRRPISEYIYGLCNELPSGEAKWYSAFYHFFHSEKIGIRKTRLSEALAELDKPIFVFIDDLDRLESDEIFEVLRLIRNAGDLRNIIYLTAYDKDYVENMLLDKGIHSSSAYLEKIFDVELQLPIAEEYQLINMFSEELKGVGFPDTFSKKLIEMVTSSEMSLIVSALHSYRQIKRFSRLFCLNLRYMHNTFSKEFKWQDVLWLSLLQVYDRKIYQILYNDRSRLLFEDNRVLYLKRGISDNYSTGKQNEQKYAGDEIWKTNTPQILDHLFGRSQSSLFSICHTEHFEKYFSLTLNPQKLTLDNFKKIFNGDSSVQALVDSWIENKLDPRSIWTKFHEAIIKTSSLEDNKHLIETYIRVCAKYLRKHIGKPEIRSIFYVDDYPNSQADKLSEIFVSVLESIIDEGSIHSVDLMKLLKVLYITVRLTQGNPKEEPKTLMYNNETITKMMQLVMDKYFRENPNTSLLDMFSLSSEFGQLVYSSTVLVEEELTSEEKDVYQNLVKDQIINFFLSSSTRYDKKLLYSAYENIVPTKEEHFKDVIEENNYYSSIEYAFSQQLTQRFGSNADWVKELMDKCSNSRKRLPNTRQCNKNKK